MKIGDKVWIFDEDNRVYKDNKGNKTSAPWYRGHFVENYIVGETKQSWIISRWNKQEAITLKLGTKIKKNEASRIIYISEEEIDKKCWIHDNRYKINEKLSRCNDYSKLKQIEEILDS